MGPGTDAPLIRRRFTADRAEIASHVGEVAAGGSLFLLVLLVLLPRRLSRAVVAQDLQAEVADQGQVEVPVVVEVDELQVGHRASQRRQRQGRRSPDLGVRITLTLEQGERVPGHVDQVEGIVLGEVDRAHQARGLIGDADGVEPHSGHVVAQLDLDAVRRRGQQVRLAVAVQVGDEQLPAVGHCGLEVAGGREGGDSDGTGREVADRGRRQDARELALVQVRGLESLVPLGPQRRPESVVATLLLGVVRERGVDLVQGVDRGDVPGAGLGHPERFELFQVSDRRLEVLAVEVHVQQAQREEVLRGRVLRRLAEGRAVVLRGELDVTNQVVDPAVQEIEHGRGWIDRTGTVEIALHVFDVPRLELEDRRGDQVLESRVIALDQGRQRSPGLVPLLLGDEGRDQVPGQGLLRGRARGLGPVDRPLLPILPGHQRPDREANDEDEDEGDRGAHGGRGVVGTCRGRR